MDPEQARVASPPRPARAVEAAMLQEDVVREIVARLSRGEGVKRIARALGIDRKTVKRWRTRGSWRPQRRRRRCRLETFRPFVDRRGPEIGWNAAVLHRELGALGFDGGYLQVQRYVKPRRDERRWAAVATVRFETAPGQQAQVDFGQLRVWIGERWETVHLFVCTLGYSRRCFAYAYPHERLPAVLDGHERAFRHFGGVPLTCLYDNPRTQVLGRSAGAVLWHPVFEDFARYYGVTPRACQPYRPQTKGKVESGVKYVKRNALAGRRFGSWEALNAWLEEWCRTVADLRVHGTTHTRPLDRFAAEALTPLGSRPPYRYQRVQTRIVPPDALVALAASRYSVPVRYVGRTVSVQETATHYELFAGAECVARHAKAGRHAVVMDPAHYAGLLRTSGPPTPPAPPQWDPAYHQLGQVAVRDLGLYAAIAEAGGAA
jgi:transposase